ncbi:MAG TPA: hypothetical protein VFZ78_11825 [Flavisolibacter sp.]
MKQENTASDLNSLRNIFLQESRRLLAALDANASEQIPQIKQRLLEIITHINGLKANGKPK